MTLQSAGSGTVQEADTRLRLANRIARFPREIRAEQIRARIKYLFVITLFFGACNGFGALGIHLLRKFLNAFDLAIPGFEHFAAIAQFAFVFWACFWPFTRRWERVFRQFFGVRLRMLRRLDQTQIQDSIRGGAKIGLHLRAFVDEDTFVPASRGEIPRALQSIEATLFITISNPQQDRPAGEIGILLLEVPSRAWKETVVELMQIASVIVLDTNAGLFHWVSDIQASSVVNFRAMSAEFGRRLGLIDELRAIIANDFAYKTVAVVPPGWAEWKASGKIAQQIVLEEYAAQRAKQLHPLLSPEGRFPRTELKSVLLELPLTVVTEDEVRTAVRGVLSKREPCIDPDH